MEEAYPGSRAVVREAMRLRDVPEEAADISIRSISDATLKQYGRGLKKWWMFCKVNNLGPFRMSNHNILRFLTTEF